MQQAEWETWRVWSTCVELRESQTDPESRSFNKLLTSRSAPVHQARKTNRPAQADAPERDELSPTFPLQLSHDAYACVQLIYLTSYFPHYSPQIINVFYGLWSVFINHSAFTLIINLVTIDVLKHLLISLICSLCYLNVVPLIPKMVHNCFPDFIYFHLLVSSLSLIIHSLNPEIITVLYALGNRGNRIMVWFFVNLCPNMSLLFRMYLCLWLVNLVPLLLFHPVQIRDGYW